MSLLMSWPRSRYVAGGGDARVCLEICGHFEKQLDITDRRFNTAGVPDGVAVRILDNDLTRFGDQMGELLRESNPELWPLLETAPQSIQLLGEVSDPTSLDYLRDTLGVVAALLKQGGVGVVDPVALQTYSPDQWSDQFWSGEFELTRHVVILVSMQKDGAIWLHTRGMRLFGRPDLSCHDVSPTAVEKLQPVFNGLIRMQAAGFIVPEGQIVEGAGLPHRLTCQHGGRLDDPNFHNLHIELQWEEVR